MTIKNMDGGAPRRNFRRHGAFLMAGSAAVLVLVSACGQKFAERCSETRSCSAGDETEGGQAGESGRAGNSSSGGTSDRGIAGSGGGGKAGEGSEDCGGGCGDGETCCDGECVDTSSDAAHCGACGHTCKGPHAKYACAASRCVVTSCDEGFIDCSESKPGCEAEDAGLPEAPRPYLPVAGAYTGAVRADKSLKPKFAWRAPEVSGSCSEVTYELELTRECEPGKLQECPFKTVDVKVEGLKKPEWTPEEPLPVSLTVPVGALYAWRVRACETKERCSEWSRVSYVNVGRLIDDVNADGYSDIVELLLPNEAVLLLGDSATPLTGTLVSSEELGESSRGQFLGDVNGDGFPDMVIWSLQEARVLLGAKTFSDWKAETMAVPLTTRHLGSRVGDLDGDGFADVAISEFDTESEAGGRGVVRLYRGASSFSLAAPISLVPPPGTDGTYFGVAMAGGFDANGDGFSDLAFLDGSDGLLHWVNGGKSFPSGIGATVSAPKLTMAFLSDSGLCPFGDRNGDGYADLMAFVSFEPAQILDGGALPSQEPWEELEVVPSYNFECVGGHDLGGDGYADLVILSRMNDLGPSVLPGSQGAASVDDIVRLGEIGTLHYYVSVGDYDGDGVWDVVGNDLVQRTVLLGGKPAPRSATCPQPASSVSQVGDWCAVEKLTRVVTDINGNTVAARPVK
jgi:hypothetical protein